VTVVWLVVTLVEDATLWLVCICCTQLCSWSC